MRRSAVQPITPDLGPLVELLERLVLVFGEDRLFDRHLGIFVRISAARHAYGNANVRLWLEHPNRKSVTLDKVVFDPTEQCGPECLNLFDGFDMEPKPGDCEPILSLLQHLCGGDIDLYTWCLNWLALPLQQPGTKMQSALVFHGPQGSGKNLFFEIVARIYGRHAKVVGQDQLEDRFNDWASQLLFAVGDEVVARAELYHQKNKLKAFITGATIAINAKMQPMRMEKNHVNVVFLSNEIQPIALEQDDRRYCVVWTPAPREKAFYEKVAQCLANGGHEAFFDYLLSLSLGDFNEFSPPPLSVAKQQLIDLGLKPAERFLKEWVDGMINLPLRVCTNDQLFIAFKRWCGFNGVRWTGEKATFTRTILSSRCKSVKPLIANRVLGDGRRQTARFIVPKGFGNDSGQTQDRWATDCERAFDDDLARYTETSREVAA